MSTDSIDVLNDITRMLIDSQKGYQNAAEVVEDHPAFVTEFRRRAAERADLIAEFQVHTRTLGGHPETDGGTLGSLHRVLTEFSALFQDDRKAALHAIDDGETHLADEIEDKIQKDGLDAGTQELLRKAHTAAKAGERFAERLEDLLDD